MDSTLIENIKIKSDLQYDFLFESKEYHALDYENKIFLKECYDMGVNQSIYLHQQDKALLESIDEGLWDRFKAGAARFGQGLKNVSGIGTPTADSKDAGVDSLLNSFKTKWAKAPKAQTSPAAGNNATNAVVSGVDNSLNKIAAASANSPTPPPTPAAAAQIIKQSNAPVGLKTKIANLIRANPGKTKFLLGVLSFGAGVAAAAATGGNPLVGKAAGALINGIGNAAIAKIQGRGTGDAVMSGLGGALAGASLASLGAGATNLLGAAAEQGVDAAMGTDGSALPVTKTPTPFPGTRPEDIVPGSANDPNQGMYQGNPASAGPGNWQSGAIAPEDQRLPDTETPDTNQYDAQGNRIYPQQQFADTSDANSPEVQVTQQQSAVSPEDLRTADTETPDTNQYDAQGNRIDPQQQFADTSDANSPEVQATQQQVANTPQGAAQPRFKSALDPRSARVAFDRSRGVIKEEKMFVKSYNNTYTIKKSLNENIEEKWNEGYEETIDEALSPEQTKIYDEFLADLGKMFKKPPGEVITFMQSQGERFKNVLDFLNAEVNPSISGAQPAAPNQQPQGQPQGQPQITPELKLDVDTKIKTLLSGLTIINPKVQRLIQKNPATKVAGNNASYVFRLTNTGDVAFIIKGWLGQTPFLYQDKPTIVQQNAQKVLVKEVAYKPIDTLKNNFIVQLSKNLALYYSKLPQLAGQLKQNQLENVIRNYLTQVAKTNPGFNKLFGSIMTLLDSVSTRMKASKTKPKQIWIGITSKGMGLFTGLPSKKKGQPQVGKQPVKGKPVKGQPVKGKPVKGKPVKGQPQVGKQPVQPTGAFGKKP